MSAVGVLIMGAGVYLMYYAVRTSHPKAKTGATSTTSTIHPIGHALTSLGKLIGKSHA